MEYYFLRKPVWFESKQEHFSMAIKKINTLLSTNNQLFLLKPMEIN